jgi:BlaI family penicillinase repressor
MAPASKSSVKKTMRSFFSTSAKPTDAELAILQILWEHQPVSVRDVNDMLNAQEVQKGLEGAIGYTTTLKIMQIMAEKGLVRRDESNKTHLYSATVSREETQKALLGKFMDAVFHGSPMQLVMQALGNYSPSKEEMKEIQKLLKSK